MDRVLDRALEAAEAAGGVQFAAAVMQGDEVVALEINEVAKEGDPSRHAEVVAIARAAQALGRRDLSDCVLLTSMQPCEMCLTCMRFARIPRLIFAARQESTGNRFFKFPQLRIEDFRRAAGNDFDYEGGIGEARVLHLYTDGAG